MHAFSFFRVRTLSVLILHCAAILLVQQCWGQPYPTKPVRIIVPFGAGTSADIIARTVAAGLTERLGAQFLVDDRPGAASILGTETVARAPADGYTVLLVNVAHVANASLYRGLPYDLMRDFAPVLLLTSAPHLVVVHPSLPAKSMRDLTILAKARPGEIRYSASQAGTPTHLAAELFKSMARIDMLFVPYKAGGQASISVISGETSVYFAPLAPAIPHVRQGRLRALAVTSAKRMSILPEYPTVSESGYAGYEAVNWFGLMMRDRTPRAMIASIRDGSEAVLKSPTVSKQLTALGYVMHASQTAEFADFLKAEIERTARILKHAGIASREVGAAE